MLTGGFGTIAAGQTPTALAQAITQRLESGGPADLARRAADQFGSEAIGRRLLQIYSGQSSADLSADTAGSAVVSGEMI